MMVWKKVIPIKKGQFFGIYVRFLGGVSPSIPRPQVITPPNLKLTNKHFEPENGPKPE